MPFVPTELSRHADDADAGLPAARGSTFQGIPVTVEHGAPASPSRRSLMKWFAAGVAAAGAGCSRPPERPVFSYAHMPEWQQHDAPTYYATALAPRRYGVGVLVGTQQGRPIKVEGHPTHPASLGGSDPMAQAQILELWHPHRLRGVTRREGRQQLPSDWLAFLAAWQRQQQAPVAGKGPIEAGAGLRILTRLPASPTQADALGRLLAKYPGSRWHDASDETDRRARAASRTAFGEERLCEPHFEHAEIVVSFGADPFAGLQGLRHAHDWASGRRRRERAGGRPAELVAIESAPSLFGARADRRIALPPSAIEDLLRAVASRMLPAPHAASSAEMPGPASPSQPDTSPLLSELIERLNRHPKGAVILAGPALSQSAQVLVHALNQHLGAFGPSAESPLSLHEPPERSFGLPPAGSIEALLADARAGRVATLLVLDGNPAFELPADAGFAQAVSKIGLTACLSRLPNETGERCAWQLPASHPFESWGDLCSVDGTTTLIQPAIAPLYDTRSSLELLTMLNGSAQGAAVDAHDDVQAFWRRRHPQDFEAFWTAALRNGLIPATANAPREPDPIPADVIQAALVDLKSRSAHPPVDGARTLEAVFLEDDWMVDGELAANGWLQELPRPFTRLTWGNAVHLGPQTAAGLGLRTGDVIGLRRSDRGGVDAAPVGAARRQTAAPMVEAPVWVLADHAEHCLSVIIGYGRRVAGPAGTGIGFASDALRSLHDRSWGLLEVAPTGRQHRFAVAHVETSQHDRELARTTESSEQPLQPPAPAGRHDLPSLYPQPDPSGVAWGMVIDLDACIGCATCTIACQAENNIPVVGPEEVSVGRIMHWIRVDHDLQPDGERLVQPVPCMHCENAPCELVCPVGATMHDSEGLNIQVYNRCIGTRFCSNNCPYKVRRFNFRQYGDSHTESLELMRNPDVTVRSRGVMEKCSYCVQRLSRRRRHDQREPGFAQTDDVLTACQAACPTSAIHFGDINDPRSDVSRQRQSPRHYAMLQELGTRPRTTYLARLRSAEE